MLRTCSWCCCMPRVCSALPDWPAWSSRTGRIRNPSLSTVSPRAPRRRDRRTARPPVPSLAPSRRRIETVAGTANRGDRLGVELAPQPDDPGIDRPVECFGVLRRGGCHDVVAREHLARIGDEEAEQGDLAGRQLLFGTR